MKIKHYNIFILNIASVFCPILLMAAQVASVRVVFQAVDETGHPISGASIRGGGWIPDGSASSEFIATTDTNGIAVADAITAMDIGGEVSKDGFYRSEFYVMYGDGGPNAIQNGRWQQSGITNIVILKHIRNPIPMYKKQVEVLVPLLGSPVGYDLEMGDWVIPYGKGETSDLVFSVTGGFERVEGRYGSEIMSDLRMTVTFSGPGNGIQTNFVPRHNGRYMGSLLAGEYEAPCDGYQTKYEYICRKRPNRKECINVYEDRDTQIAYLRVRSELDENGQVMKAWYGKLHGDIHAQFKPDGTPWVFFTYYLNPDGTRNIEYDPRRNLFPDLRGR